METENIIASHLKAIEAAQQKLTLIQTMDKVFAWSIFTAANKDNFFNQIISYLNEVMLLKQLPIAAQVKAEQLLNQYQDEYTKLNQSHK